MSLITWIAPFACCVKTQMPLDARDQATLPCLRTQHYSCAPLSHAEQEQNNHVHWLLAWNERLSAKLYGSEWNPITLKHFPGYKRDRRARKFPYLQGTGTTVITKAVFPGFGLHCTLEGWFPRVPQNLGARCAIFDSRADERSRS